MVDGLWIKYDQENTGRIDNIETLNFVNQILTLHQMNKINNISEFNQNFNLYDKTKDGQICKEDLIKLVELFMEDLNSNLSDK